MDTTCGSSRDREGILADVEAKLQGLDRNGPLRPALENSLNAAQGLDRERGDAPRQAVSWPLLFCLASRKEVDVLRRLEGDLSLVLQNTPEGKKVQATAFLTTLSNVNVFRGGLHDIYMKATLLSKADGGTVKLEYKAPGASRDCDALASIAGVCHAEIFKVLSVIGEDGRVVYTLWQASGESERVSLTLALNAKTGEILHFGAVKTRKG